MNLVIDVGNTQTKLAVFKNGKIKVKKRIETKDIIKQFNSLEGIYGKFNSVILSYVGKLKENILQYLKEHSVLTVVSHKTNFPFNNLYATPKTLGIDRLVLVSASVEKYTNKNVLIIDAGTCITYDFIDAKNNYLGGAISPGIRMRYHAMHNQTANLPLLKTKVVKTIIGNSTAKSMHSGVIYGVVNEIDGCINTYKEKYKDLTVILTGGDAKMLSKQLKSSIFANSNFLLEGLNFILKYNSN